jgi:hypothetical protein
MGSKANPNEEKITSSDKNVKNNDQENIDASANNELLISDTIDLFLHRVQDIEDCADRYVTVAEEAHNLEKNEIVEELKQSKELLEDKTSSKRRLLGMRNLQKTFRKLKQHSNSSPAQTLERSLFVNLFSAFDKYIGDLISALYQNNLDLYKNIKGSFCMSEIFNYTSIGELRQKALDEEIESLRRKSYKEQFESFEQKFSIKLKKFDEWSDFIERAQRRNLFTHCDGIVSEQYIQACNNEQYKFKNETNVGDQLEIGNEYFFDSCGLIMKVAVMLGHTLWRKSSPEQLEKADAHLSHMIFNFLHSERWDDAISLSKFALNLPKISSDQIARMFTINYAIALKAKGNKTAARNMLNKKDWSATSYEFRLAYEIILENYTEASSIMEKIGEEGEIIDELAYHDWPLFRDFRSNKEFFRGYESVYGYKYYSKLSEIAEDEKSKLEESTEKKSEVGTDKGAKKKAKKTACKITKKKVAKTTDKIIKKKAEVAAGKENEVAA